MGEWKFKEVSIDGSNCLVTFKLSGKGLYAEVDEVFTRENLRHQGFGTKLTEKVKKIAKEKGCYKIILHVRFENIPALMLYLKNDFKIRGLSLRYDVSF